MRRDPTEFRARFKAYKEGKMPYDAGLPKFAEGTGGVENNITEEYTPLASNVYQPMVNNAKQKIAKFAIDDYVYRVQKQHPEVTREQVQEVYNNTPYIGSDSRKGTTVGQYWHGEDDGYGRRVMIYPRSMRSDDPEFNLQNRIYSTVLHESNHLFRDVVLGGKYTDKEREYLEAAYPGVPINEAAALNAQIREKLSTIYGNGATGKKLDATLEKVRQNKGMQNEMMFHRNNLNEYGHTDKINGQWDSKIIDAMTNALINVASIQSKPSRGLIRAKNGKLPGYAGGKIPYVASDGTQYNINPNVVDSDQINITTPEIVVTGTDRRPTYQRYDAGNSTYDPDAVRMFTDWAPVISDVGDGLDAYNAFKNKDWSQFGIIAGAALLPNVVEKALQPVQRFVQPIAKRYISPLVDKYISPTIDRLFSNTKQLSLPSSETSQHITADDFNFDFSPSLEDSRATAVRNATEQSVLDAFDSRLPYAKNTNGPLVRAVPATMENNKKLVDHFLQQIKEKYPGVSDEEAKKLFEQIHEASVDDVLYARGMTVRDPVTHEVKFVSYNNQGNNTRSAATKTHEENHTLYDLSPDRFQHHTVTVLDSPLGVKKNYLNEEAGYSLPKNISNPNDYDGVEEYLSADEVSSFMSEAKSLLGKTEDEALTEGDIKWFIKNNNIIGDRLQQRSVYKSIAEHITNAKKFAQWCNDYSNVVAALTIGGAATAAATMPEYADGKLPGYKNGKIHIKPANRGKFTALKKRTGHSASWFKENGTPAQKKMAVFALNAKKWKH